VQFMLPRANNYGGSFSPPREPPKKKRVIPRRGPTATTMAGGDAKEGASSPRMVVVERGFGGVEIPKLTKTNYREWPLEVQCNLEGMELCEAVEGGSVERSKDRRALAVILRGVPPGTKSEKNLGGAKQNCYSDLALL
jgi:hypothetical protein